MAAASLICVWPSTSSALNMITQSTSVQPDAMVAAVHHLRDRTRIAQYRKPMKQNSPKPNTTGSSHALWQIRHSRLDSGDGCGSVSKKLITVSQVRPLSVLQG